MLSHVIFKIYRTAEHMMLSLSCMHSVFCIFSLVAIRTEMGPMQTISLPLLTFAVDKQIMCKTCTVERLLMDKMYIYVHCSEEAVIGITAPNT
jgi:hypothetical protein